MACRDLDSVRRYDLLGAADQSPLQEITGCNSPRDVTFTADGERGLFSCTETIQVYDVQSGTVAYEIPGFEDVRAFAANTAGTRAYVADRRADGGFLQVVNLETYDIVNTVQVDRNPADVFLSPDDDLVYVISTGNSELSIHDAAGAILSTEPAPVYPFSGAAVRVPAE